MQNDSITIIMKMSLDKKLTSSSNIPILVYGLLEFRADRVSLPTNKIKPIAVPLARTVLVHKVFSKFKGSTLSSLYSTCC